MLMDVNAATDWLRQHRDVDNKRIRIIGSSLGASIALRYAQHDDELASLILFSPGLNDPRGLRTDDAMSQLAPVPLRIVVSRNDAFAFQSSQRLLEIRKQAGQTQDDQELMVCTGNLHGTDMLRGVKRLPELLLEWLKQVFSMATPDPGSPPSKRSPQQ